MGYTKDDYGNLKIVPEEAEIIKKIFYLRMIGYSGLRIAKYLEDNKIKTVMNHKWYSSTIEKMLSNEKYIGDALLQKNIYS